MENLNNNAAAASAAWFSKWFNTPYYHKLYAHRSDEEATGFIESLLTVLQPNENDRVLDVGCGNGRHCRQLAKICSVTGIDIAPASIREAKQKASSAMQFYVHDMRLPFGNKAYEFVFNFFTSFGYFEDYGEQLKVLGNMVQALKPGGKLVLDYLNIYPAERKLVPQEEKEIDGIVYNITRWMDAGYFYKQIMINDSSMQSPLVYTEQVARFNLGDFKEMFRLCGLKLLEVYGDYDLGKFNEEQSPRLVLIAQKSQA